MTYEENLLTHMQFFWCVSSYYFIFTNLLTNCRFLWCLYRWQRFHCPSLSASELSISSVYFLMVECKNIISRFIRQQKKLCCHCPSVDRMVSVYLFIFTSTSRPFINIFFMFSKNCHYDLALVLTVWHLYFFF